MDRAMATMIKKTEETKPASCTCERDGFLDWDPSCPVHGDLRWLAANSVNYRNAERALEERRQRLG
jgi:hypothetical protein